MIHRSILVSMLSLAAACATSSRALPAAEPAAAPEPTSASFEPPPTRRETVVETIHGVEVADPYRWLENAESAEVQRWMSEQDAAARAYLTALPGREDIRTRFKTLTSIDFTGPPWREGDRYFFFRAFADAEAPIVYVQDGLDGTPRVLFDLAKIDPDPSVAFRGLATSPDGTWAAYGKAPNNADAVTLYVRDIDAGTDSTVDVIEGVRYGTARWTPDSKGFLYPWVPADAPSEDILAHRQIRYHALGTAPADDPVVVEAPGDPSVFVDAYVSEDGHWLFVDRSRGDLNEVSFRDLRSKGGLFGPLTPLVTGMESATYTVTDYRDLFYIVTDEGAPRGRMFTVDPRHPERERWTELVPQSDRHLLSGGVYGKRLVLSYSHNAYITKHVHDLSGRRLYDMAVPGIGLTTDLDGREDDDEVFFNFESMDRLPTVYRASISTGKAEVWATIDAPIDTSTLETTQVWYESKDGTKVSMFILAAKGTTLDGSHPVLMYGYGGFGSSQRPSSSPLAMLWVERGGIYAVPNLRGGGEYGEAWHQAGMLANKQNTFDDLIAAAEYLIDKGYTSSERLAIMGGSNGGLLVGAAMVQRPELFGAVVCSVPLLDMVRYPEFGIGHTWIPEYGDPSKEADFRVLYSYSPYHHVTPDTDYPALLMLSADSDDRVDPMHARKFVAAIQAASTSGRPAALRIEKHAGHGGSSSGGGADELEADRLAFLYEQLGM